MSSKYLNINSLFHEREMKRSEINKIMRNATKFLKEQNFHLPKFAFWKLNDWKKKGMEIKEIFKVKLGWDITDYGSGDFSKIGLMHFTIRNGTIEDVNKGGKDYCEKIMIMEEGQQLPMHFHFNKMEDIINRGGGVLIVQLYNSTVNNEFEDTNISISIDGEIKVVNPGGIIDLSPGESITIPGKIFHKFWAKEKHGKVLIGEVSRINDDKQDNFYYEKVGRFPEIEEDEEPLYLLVSDYEKFLNK
jgi:D-lyxose ketol-isomerase